MRYKIDPRQTDIFFTADEHLSHDNIRRYCNRPFTSVEEMNETIINNFNSVVPTGSITFHGGDFYLGPFNREQVNRDIISRLNGSHVFMNGNHDRWLKGDTKVPDLLEIVIGDATIVISHYCLRTWSKSHFNSWHLFGHSHGTLEPIGKSWDIGVDNNNFFPLSLHQIKGIMETRPDNPNLIPTDKRKY